MTSRGLVFKNLFRKKLRTFLTIFAILVAFAIFGVLAAFQSTLANPPAGPMQTRLVTTNFINFTESLPYSYFGRVQAHPNAKVVTHWSWFGGYYQEPKNFLIAGYVDAATFLDVYAEFALPPEQREAFLKDRQGMLVGKPYADQYGWKVGDRVPIKSNIWRQKDGGDSWEFNVSGIFTDTSGQKQDQQVVFHYDYINESISFGRDQIGQTILVPKDASKNDQTAQEIDRMFQNSAAETETRTEAAFAQSFAAQLGDLGFIITAVVGAAFVTILLIAGNTMMLTVRERTGEIAVLKTIGFTARRIFTMVIAESLLLAFIGGLIGIGLAMLGIAAINSLPGAMFGNVALTPTLLATSFGLMALLGLVTGALPAWRAMNTDIVTAFGRK